MKKLLRKLKNKAKKALKEIKVFKPANYGRARYFWYRDHCPINESAILLEASDGKYPADNIAAVCKELAENPEYANFELYLAGRRGSRRERTAYLKRVGLKGRVKLLEINSTAYYKCLATTKYLISGEAFIYIFTKRPEQVYLNVWHGTPLKTMGRNKKADFALVGNEQKTFFDADFLLCQSRYAMEHMIEDYCLENFAKTKIWLSGLPRNEVFFKKEQQEQIRIECGFADKQVIAYMPTWRKNITELNEADRAGILQKHLAQWDALASGQQLIFVKQHPVNAVAIDYSAYKNIRPFPENYGTYEFLSAADMLVTDYSGVMFDFALTGRKTVVFNYDEEWYRNVRGLHKELSELPFPKAESIEELVEELQYPKRYEDAEFKQEFCAYDREGVTAALCRKFIFGEGSNLVEERETPYNGKKNVVLYIGGFEKNGLTSAGANLLHNLDRTTHNYAVFYCMTSVQKNQDSIRVIPTDLPQLTFYHYRALTFAELVPYMLWRGSDNIPYRKIQAIMDRLSLRSAQRMLLNCRIDTVVQFTGYNDEMIGCMEKMPCNRVIYVHSDMEKEINLRSNANKGLLSHAYKAYDSVAVITEGMIAPAKRIAESDKGEGAKEPNFVLCRNVIDYKRIRNLGELALEFDSTTAFNVTEEEVRNALASDKKKFVSVGRFSVEKGHERLIKAFERLHAEYQDTCLFIVGGHGDLWNKTVRQVQESSCPDAVFLVRYMSNPFPLVKQCDFFALSSLYEGFGLVLAEADILGLPCFTTDITGPRSFMQQYGGLMVEDSEDGLYSGMQSCMMGTIAPCLTIDYEQYNNEAVAQFESII